MAVSLVREAATRVLRPLGEGLRQLIPVPQHSGSTRAFGEGYRATQIQQKKEELYDLIADAQANSAASQRDRFVLKTLCTQVKPRPHDPQWREIITVKKASKRAVSAFVFVTGGITLVALPGCAQGSGA